MGLDAVARSHYRQQSSLTSAAARALQALWGELDPAAPAESWTSAGMGERMLVALSTFQAAAAAAAPDYTARAVAAQGAGSDPLAALEPRALAGVASDGRPLATLLTRPLATALAATRAGADPARAMQVGESSLVTIAATQTADAGRAAEHVTMATEPAVTGYMRMLVPPACGRCAVLAGRRYRRRAAFARHPHCDCRTIPAVEDRPDDLRTDPDAYFRSLPADQQARYFTKAGAEAIRGGADIGQVVNARRGAAGLSAPGRLTAAERAALDERGRLQRVDAYGRQVYVTSEGTVRGYAAQQIRAWSGDVPAGLVPRLMPESVLDIAGDDRDQAVLLLERFGYVVRRTPAQRTPDRERIEIPAPPPAPPTPRDLSDDDLFDAMEAALAAEDLDRFAELGEESDRREAATAARNAANERRRARRADQAAAIEEEQGRRFEALLDAGVDEEEAVARAYGIPAEQQRRDRARARLQASGYDGTWAQMTRTAYRDRLRELYFEAEDVTNGYMLSREGENRHLDPKTLFTGTDAYARRWASDELLEHWDQTGGRMTYDRYVAEELLGDSPAGAREDFLR